MAKIGYGLKSAYLEFVVINKCCLLTNISGADRAAAQHFPWF